MNLTAQLSKRENEVAEIMAFTKSKSDAADKLCISEGTLSAHTFRIYEKLGINSKSELVIWWMVTRMHVEKQLIPYFKLVPVVIISYCLLHSQVYHRPVRRIDYTRIYTSSK